MALLSHAQGCGTGRSYTCGSVHVRGCVLHAASFTPGARCYNDRKTVAGMGKPWCGECEQHPGQHCRPRGNVRPHLPAMPEYRLGPLSKWYPSCTQACAAPP